MSSQVSLEETEASPLVTLEDVTVCEDCIKADVCEIFKSVARLGSAVQHIQMDYDVKIVLNASIFECKHKVSQGELVKSI